MLYYILPSCRVFGVPLGTPFLRGSTSMAKKAKEVALTPLRKAAKLWDKWGDHLREDSYDPNTPDGRRERIKFERMLKNFSEEGGKFEDTLKKAKGGIIKSRKKSIDGVARRGKTRATQR